jgi:hypothetical protein
MLYDNVFSWSSYFDFVDIFGTEYIFLDKLWDFESQ